MIAALIRWSVANRILVLMATLFLVAAAVVSTATTPVDALPDLSDTQVIVRTSYPQAAACARSTTARLRSFGRRRRPGVAPARRLRDELQRRDDRLTASE